MNQFFDDEDDGKDFEMAGKPVSAVENSNSNSLPSIGETAGDGVMQSTGGSPPIEPMDYVANREEILVLVMHWYTQYLDDSWYFFIYRQSGGSDEWRKWFVLSRIALADAAVGKEAVDQAIKEAREKFKARINNNRLWDIYENGSQKEWDEVLEETPLNWHEHDSAEFGRRLEELEAVYPNDMVALVLGDWPEHKRKPVLVSTTLNPKLAAALQASEELEVETDKSRITALVVNQKFTEMGFLRIRRENGRWRFSAPDSKQGTIGWKYLRWLVGRIGPELKGRMGGGSERP